MGGIPQFSIEELKGYHKSLANSTTTEKQILTELVKSNATLATSTESLTATIAGLQNQLGTISRGKNLREYRVNQKLIFPHCKKEVFHSADDCYKLETNAQLCPPGWKSSM